MSTGDEIVQRDLVPLLRGRPGGRAVTEESVMQQPESKSAITRDKYDAVLLDLVGVITDTATIHATCWTQMFDAYLQQSAADTGEPFAPFDDATDYRIYVEDKPGCIRVG